MTIAQIASGATSENEPEKCSNCDLLASENARLAKALEDMAQLASHDVLTGLCNRRGFLEHLQSRILRCQRYGDNSALVFLDVDNLKDMNDQHGHSAGDALLVRLAEILRTNIRQTDMVARIGGDEFALLIDNLDADEVEAKLATLSHRITSADVRYDGDKLQLSAAMGYCFVGPKDDIETLMSRADAAMYRAKRG